MFVIDGPLNLVLLSITYFSGVYVQRKQMFGDRIKSFFQNNVKNFKTAIPDAFHNVVDTTKNVKKEIKSTYIQAQQMLKLKVTAGYHNNRLEQFLGHL